MLSLSFILSLYNLTFTKSVFSHFFSYLYAHGLNTFIKNEIRSDILTLLDYFSRCFSAAVIQNFVRVILSLNFVMLNKKFQPFLLSRYLNNFQILCGQQLNHCSKHTHCSTYLPFLYKIGIAFALLTMLSSLLSDYNLLLFVYTWVHVKTITNMAIINPNY